MDFPRSPDGVQRQRNGAALVIILAIVVLLTGVIVAYFSRSMFSRQVANTSVGQTKAALLAQSASDQIIADFKQEILLGSTPTPVGTGSNQTTMYVPTSNLYAAPIRSGNPTPNPTVSPMVDPIPNLIRRSVRPDAAPTPTPAPFVGSRASAVNSTNDAATDGRTVSLARWNSHYLIPRFDQGTMVSTTPDASAYFTAPDWVILTQEEGPVQMQSPTKDAKGNTVTPIGRYAYAVYDEGGLLDMNVAGHPPATAAAATGPIVSPAPTPFSAPVVATRSLLALADLTQLPIVKTPASAGDYLSQTQVNNFVGWRNFASASLTSNSYPAFSFSSSNGTSWYNNFAYNNKNGYRQAYSASASNGNTDQMLLSRQQLIKLTSSMGFDQNVLQYMGTFSRALEQPSFVPAHLRYPNTAPSINALSTSTPPPDATSGQTADNYAGNNDAAGFNSASIAYQDVYNPAFLTVRVQAAFTRQDGSTAVVGEPLVKKKFPLSRLGEMSYLATSSTPSITDPAAASNHIQDWFGLSRTSASAPWTYSHGGTNGGGTYIRPLSEVAAANREPDFAELLKAAINVGSLAKGGPNLNVGIGSNYQYTVDTMVDLNVLQIMANLIDQSDTDSFPTVIQLQMPNGGGYRTVRGVEDLPYFYRYRPMGVVTRLPAPLLTSSDTLAWHPVGSTSVVGTTPYMSGATLTDPGLAVMLYVPEVWNPHDSSLTYGAANASSYGPRPTSFRLEMLTSDPLGGNPWQTGAIPAYPGAMTSPINIPPTASIPTTSTTSFISLTDTTTAYTFSDNGGLLFREPTLLWRSDAPAGSNLTPDPASVIPQASGSNPPGWIDANTKGTSNQVSYFGALVGTTPISFPFYIDPTSPTSYYASKSGDGSNTPVSSSGNYFYQMGGKDNAIAAASKVLPNGYIQYTFRLQYQDPSGAWITYDEKYPDIHGLYTTPSLVVDKNSTAFPSDEYLNPWTSHALHAVATDYDPRAARFGVGTQCETGDSGPVFIEQGASANYNLDTKSGNDVFPITKATMVSTQRPYSDQGNDEYYSNPGMTSNPGQNRQMRWFSGVGYSASNGATSSPTLYDGLLEQNSPNVNILARDGATVAQIYYEDADGVARRAMGAYGLTGMLPPANTGTTVPSPTVDTSPGVEGLPEVRANDYSVRSYGVGVPNARNLNRPMMLNRPFRSVEEMSYASRGGVWKQIDFSTPESGDSALLDVFTVNDPPVNPLVAGKVNLNTRQAPVLQAILSGASRDELANLPSPPAYAQPALSAAETANVASALVKITSDLTDAWRGPLSNLGDIVGRYVDAPGSTGTATDLYTFNEPVTSKSYTYAGLSAALDGTVYTNATIDYKAQRLRSAAMRPLIDAGQTRVWNLLIDVVAQSGRYGPYASALSQFSVDGEKRYWVHVAIDRLTGEVLDKQIEVVTE